MKKRDKKIFSVKSSYNWDYTSIYVNDILHIQLPSSGKFAFQSWKDTVNCCTKYIIQFVNSETGKMVLTCEYDDIVKWQLIISEWDKISNNR